MQSNEFIQKNDVSLERMVAQRFEAKYILTEAAAQAIISYIQPYVHPDPHGRIYPINSCYLDSDDLKLYWSSEMGEKNRFKLRVRSYSEKPEAPLFLEIKRRVDQIIKKQRVMVPRDKFADLLNGFQIREDLLLKPTEKEIENFHQFRELMETLAASPKAMVRYLREAFVGDFEQPVRITFDRNLSALHSPAFTPDIWEFNEKWSEIEDYSVIMEIKFTDTFPFWVEELIQRFNLMRISMAKYVACVKGLQREGFLLGSGGDRAT